MSTLTMPPEEVEIPFSILDTDLYKFTMQYVVLQHVPQAHVIIRFTNRSPAMRFSRQTFDWAQERINKLSTLRLTSAEREKLSKACPYFPDTYLDYLSNISLDPQNQVKMAFHPKEGSERGEISIEIEGPWRDCILYEVPIMSILSEGYFKFDDTDWNMDGQRELAKRKALQLLNPPENITPLSFAEFGTRRRRSFHAQDVVMRGLMEGDKEWKSEGGGKNGGGLAGTSNVYFALKYGIPPSGTIAHEWIMAIGALYGYRGSNGRAMDMWEQVYSQQPRPPLTMLTDTFTAEAFFVDFIADPSRALRWDALRQDSGDPRTFVKLAKQAWQAVEGEAGVKREDGSVAVGKKIIFSDGLDVAKAVDLQKLCDELGMSASFGIGTFLTNDFKKVSDPDQVSKPLNMVIKLNQIDGKDCVKLSDDKGKYTGKLEEVRRVQRELNLPTEHEEQQRG